jgi:hypothetical protein
MLENKHRRGSATSLNTAVEREYEDGMNLPSAARLPPLVEGP